MYKYLPSKKIIVAVIILIVIFAAMLFVSKYQTDREEVIDSFIADGVVLGGTDTDNDGLKDWEEALWGTDVRNPDTDGDGTSDGSEISQNRNPLVQGPDDVLSEELISKKGDVGAPLSETDELTREFIRQYTLLRQSGDISNEELDALAKNFADTALLNNTSENKYSYDYIQTAPTTKTFLYTYANIISEILDADTSQGSETERDIFRKVFNENQIKEASKLSSFEPMYKKIEQDLLLVETPKIVSIYHMELVNSFANMASALEEIQKIEADPIKGFRGMTAYKNNAEKVVNAVKNIASVLRTQNIEFDKNDPAHQLMSF